MAHSPKKEVNLSFQFIVPSDVVLEAARKMADSNKQDERDVGKAVLDTTEITTKTKAAIADTTNQGKFDLGVYFDHWLGDSLETAKRLLSSPDENVRNVAETLIAQSKAIIQSKEFFLKTAKQHKK